ncbi:ABC transporter permease [Comamonas phosphati]|nr:ABC transporter permease [Comamonas phosphati]
MLLAALLAFSITIAVTWGSVHIAPSTVWRIAGAQVLQRLGADPAAAHTWSVQQFQIVWMIRMPRVLLAALVGAGLAVVGVVMQAMVRNPLADPYLLGVSSGASVGAVSVLAYGSLAAAGAYALTAGAFAGALAATLVVYALAHVRGRIHATRLILSGVAVGYVLVGITSLITLTSGQRELAAALMTWTLGTLAGTEWGELGLPTLVLAASIAWLLLQARALNALGGGEETAVTLGVNTHDLRRRLFVVVSLLTGTMVAVSGAIGFIGLVIPHMTRMLVGSNHRRVLPVAALGGAIFLVLVDLLARTWLAPTEIPAGVVTSLIGGPFFVWMLVRNTGFGGHAA